MHHRLLVSVLLVMVSLLTPLTRITTSAQSQADLNDTAAAAAAAQQILQLATSHDFNALYDRLHPDAQAVVPRAAAVGAFQALYTSDIKGPAQILGVQLVKWTWPVNGKTYNRTAQVSFALQSVDQNGKATWFQDKMFLVQDDQGAWRWFFGNSKQFVEDAIKNYGNTRAPSPQLLTEGNLIQNVVNDLDAFWRDVISYTSYTYKSPRVVVVDRGQSAMSGCGPAEGNFAAFYCPPDMTLYLDKAFLDQLINQGMPFAAAFVIAHEWAHHIQSGVGLVRVGAGQTPTKWNQVYSIELELMADCMAGAWAQDATARGVLKIGDADQATELALNFLGDPAGIGETDPQAHGNGEQRARFFRSGYENGFLGCNVKLQS